MLYLRFVPENNYLWHVFRAEDYRRIKIGEVGRTEDGFRFIAQDGMGLSLLELEGIVRWMHAEEDAARLTVMRKKLCEVGQ